MRRPLLLLVAALLGATPATRATIYYVDSSVSSNGAGTSWATALKNVQDGIDSARANGDEVWVKKGTYYPTEDPNGTVQTGAAARDHAFYIKSYDIRLYGGFAGTETAAAQRNPATNVTILSGDINAASTATNDCYHVLVTLGRSSACVIDGFTVQGGAANGSGSFSVTTPAVSFLRTAGGGIYNISSSPTISSCFFSSNAASNGGGGGMYNSTSSPAVSSCVFSGNTVINNNGGGMVNASSSNPTVSSCVFSSNTTSIAGGGMYNSSNSNPTISSCVFSSNTAGTGGGGMYNSNCAPAVSGCVFSSNTASGGGGGGMYNTTNVNSTISNCVFSSNRGSGLGGGMYSSNCSPALSSCTFYDNQATGSSGLGGGIYYASNAGGTVTNCILRNNTTPANSANANREEIYKAGTSTTLTVSYSIVDDYSSSATNNYTAGSGIITSDPSFANTADPDGSDNTWRTADDGLRIGCSSPARDAGTGATPVLDIIGNTRKGIMDLGAYEATATSSTASNTVPSVYTAVSLSQTAAALSYSDCDNEVLKIDATSPRTLSGSTIAKVYVQGTAPSFNSQPYVRRYYDVTPSSGASTATATLTLYFTQGDFTDYNTAKPAGYPSLPIDATDAANNKANLRITQQHGTSSTSAPGSYSGFTGSGNANVLITPASVTWNSTASRWEVTFSVTGFSGFFAHTTITNTPLPIGLSAFGARLISNNDVLLSWRVANAAAGKEYTIERSGDGATFTAIGTAAAATAGEYGLHDYHPLGGRSYYRLRIAEQDNRSSYSNVADIFIGSKAYVNVSPSPAHDYFSIATSATGLSATLSDMQGKVRQSVAVSNGVKVDISALPAGVYLLKLSSGEVMKVVKE